MKLVVYVMTKTELLDSFLHELQENKIKGATILNSTGMARKLIESDDMNFIGSLKSLFDKPRKESYVILMAVAEEKEVRGMKGLKLGRVQLEIMRVLWEKGQARAPA